MTERIIDFLDALVATVGAVDKRYCLVEKRADVNGTNIPYKYTGNGNYEAVNVDGGSISYWRIVNSVSFDVVDGNKAVKNLQASYPIRYVAMVRRDDINPLTFSQDVANVLEGRNKDLQTQLQAKNVNITVGSIDTDTVNIWGEEFAMPLTEPNYTRSIVMIDLTVTVIAARSCWESCDNFPDILQGFDWCDPSTYQRLTQEQQDCLQDFLCGACADSTVQLNGTTVGTVPSGDTESFTVNLDGSPSGVWDGTAWQVTSPPCADATIELNGIEMTTIPSGDTENILVLQSSGMTQVGSKQGVHWRVGDATVENSDGTYSATVAAEGSLVLPNINFTDSDGTTSSVPSVQDIIATPCTGGGTLTIGVFSDAGFTTPIVGAINVGTTVYLKSVAVGITPTEYVWSFPNAKGGNTEVTTVVDNVSWTPEIDGVLAISLLANDGSVFAGSSVDITVNWDFGQAVDLNGSTSFAISNNRIYSNVIVQNNWTVSMWFNADSLANAPIIFTNGNRFFIEVDASNVYIGIATTVFRTYSTSISTGAWHNVVVSKIGTGNQLKVWLDGVELTSFTGSVATVVIESLFLYVGKYSSGAFNLNGKMNDVCVFEGHTPTNAQVLDYWNSGNGRHPLALGKAPDYYWTLNGNLNEQNNLELNLTGTDITYTPH